MMGYRSNKKNYFFFEERRTVSG